MVVLQRARTSTMGKASTGRVTSRFFPKKEEAEAVQRVPDYLEPNLDIVFCGINPGAESGTQQRHYAHRSNHFYLCLYQAGVTKARLLPADDWTFPSLTPYRLGLTNLAHRPTPRSEQLLPSELTDGVPSLLDKVRIYQPRCVCFVGKQIGQVFLRVLQKEGWVGPETTELIVPRSVLGFWFVPPKKGKPADEADMPYPRGDAGYGVLAACMVHANGRRTLFFSTPSSSARVTHHQLPGKVRIMSHLLPLLDGMREGTCPDDTERLISIPCIRVYCTLREGATSAASHVIKSEDA